MRKFIIVLSIFATVKLQAQNVGIGTTAPLARLHVADSAVLFSGTASLPSSTTSINPPLQGAGIRMMWFPALGAFRTGYVDGVQWNRDSIGLLSFATGYNTKAKGSFSTSLGRLTVASSAIATSMGFGTKASGEVSTSMGNGTIASGFTATSMGISTQASGDFSTSMGDLTVASGVGAFASGGSTLASGGYAASLGEQTLAKARGAFTAGVWNDNADAPNATTTASTDRIFQIGNGTSSIRSNAFTVLRNGNIGIGITDPLFKLDMSGRMLLRGNGTASNSPGVAFTNINGDLYKGLVGMQSDSVMGFLASGINGTFWGMNMNVDNGRIGIGTTNPRAQFHIKGTSSSALPALWLNAADDINQTTLKLSSPAVSGYSWQIVSTINPDVNDFSNNFSISRLVDSAAGLVISPFVINKDGYVGIGTYAPITPLSFPPSLGKKISLYPGSTGDVGIGVYGNELRQYIDGQNGNITFGFDNISNGFTEYVRIASRGNVGIGTSLPKARLHIADSAVLFTGSTSMPPLTSTINPPIEGAGTRMMWFPSLGAFRAGYVDGTQWDRNNIGRLSFASGANNTASGENAIAMGFLNSASGLNSICLGKQNAAMGSSAISIGSSNVVGNFAIAVGTSNQAGNPGAVALGEATAAVGYGSFTAGIATKAYAYGGSSVGSYNDDTDAPDPENPALTDRIFQIGNGDFQTPTNAMTVLRNGNTGIGILNPAFLLDVGARMRIRSTPGNTAGIWLNNDANNAQPSFIGLRTDNLVGFYGNGSPNSGWGMLMNTSNGRVGIGTDNPSQALHVIGNILASGTITQNSDARLKKDITPLSNTLQTIQQITGYTYHWKDTSNPGELIGLLAQELQKVYPQLVKENEQGTLSVNYSGMVPVLLEAIKQQQKQIEIQNKRISELENKIK